MLNDSSDLNEFEDGESNDQDLLENSRGKFNYSQNKSDQIKELGLDDIDSSSEDEIMPTTSSYQQPQKQSLKRTLSTSSKESFNDNTNLDNDYDADFNDTQPTSTKKLKTFLENDLSMNEHKNDDEQNLSKNMSADDENNLSGNQDGNDNNSNNNNNNDLSLNEDSEGGKKKGGLSSKAKERLQQEREKNLRKKRLEQQEEENKKMQVLMANFSDEQLNRYEMFRRSAFPKANVKRIMQTICGKTVAADVVIGMSGMAKVFVGEIVELALDIQQKWNESGPLHPKHIREAFRVYKKQNKIATSYKSKKPSMLN